MDKHFQGLNVSVAMLKATYFLLRRANDLSASKFIESYMSNSRLEV